VAQRPPVLGHRAAAPIPDRLGDVSLASDERSALCDEFERAGTDRPTLCAGWTTRDLLAHLLVRERQPWASAGMFVAVLAPVTRHATRRYADTPWTELVGLLRGGPPAWSPFAIGRVDAVANGAEFFVHHEDVRRGEPGWEPRAPEAKRDGQLWALLLRSARLLYRRSPVGIVLRRPDGTQHVVRTGSGVVTIVGEPGEIVLHAFGRDAVRVELVGLPADVATLAAAPRGV
jgi:uncharacterized protein (TIGR03085 family)